MTAPTPPRTTTLYLGNGSKYLGEVGAHLVPAGDLLDESLLDPPAGTWTITHTMGGLASGTYTEVRFAPEVLDRLAASADDDGLALDAHAIERLLDDLVRQVANALYGRAWAFHYRPAQYGTAIARYALRRREVVVVDSVKLYS